MKLWEQRGGKDLTSCVYLALCEASGTDTRQLSVFVAGYFQTITHKQL